MSPIEHHNTCARMHHCILVDLPTGTVEHEPPAAFASPPRSANAECAGEVTLRRRVGPGWRVHRCLRHRTTPLVAACCPQPMRCLFAVSAAAAGTPARLQLAGRGAPAGAVCSDVPGMRAALHMSRPAALTSSGACCLTSVTTRQWLSGEEAIPAAGSAAAAVAALVAAPGAASKAAAPVASGAVAAAAAAGRASQPRVLILCCDPCPAVPGDRSRVAAAARQSRDCSSGDANGPSTARNEDSGSTKRSNSIAAEVSETHTGYNATTSMAQ